MSEIATATASDVEERERRHARSRQTCSKPRKELARLRSTSRVSVVPSDIGATASQVLSAAGELSRQSETLRRDVDAFLTTVRASGEQRQAHCLAHKQMLEPRCAMHCCDPDIARKP